MMRSILLLLAFATPFVAATRAQDPGGAADVPDQSKKADADPKDFEPLQGAWRVVKVTMDGKEIRDRGVSDSTLTFKGSALVWEGGEPRERFSLGIRPSRRSWLRANSSTRA